MKPEKKKTLHERLKEKKKKRKLEEDRIQHLDADQLRTVVTNYTRQGLESEQIVMELRDYRYGGRPIDKSTVVANLPSESVSSGSSGDPTRDKLLKLWEKAVRDKDFIMQKKCERLLGLRKRKNSGMNKLDKMSIKDFKEIAEGVDAIRGVVGGGAGMPGQPGQSGNQPLRWNTLDPNPNTAQAQVYASSFDSAMNRLAEAVERASGKRTKDEVDADEIEAVKAEIAKVERQARKIKLLYASCPHCGANVPRDAVQCVNCKHKFDVTKENLRMAHEGRKMEQQSKHVDEEDEEEAEPEHEEEAEATDEGEISGMEPDVADTWFNPKGDNGYLWRLKNKIDDKDDPVRSCDGMWGWIKSAKDRKALLYVSKVGFARMFILARRAAKYKPHLVTKYKLDELIAFYEKVYSKEWVGKFLGEVQLLAQEEKLKLEPAEEKRFNAKLKRALGSGGIKKVRCEKCHAKISIDRLAKHKCGD